MDPLELPGVGGGATTVGGKAAQRIRDRMFGKSTWSSVGRGNSGISAKRKRTMLSELLEEEAEAAEKAKPAGEAIGVEEAAAEERPLRA